MGLHPVVFAAAFLDRDRKIQRRIVIASGGELEDGLVGGVIIHFAPIAFLRLRERLALNILRSLRSSRRHVDGGSSAQKWSLHASQTFCNRATRQEPAHHIADAGHFLNSGFHIRHQAVVVDLHPQLAQE